MSYILDALRRSESERHGGVSGGHAPPPARPRRATAAPVLAGAAAGIAAMAVSVYLATRPALAPIPPVTGTTRESLLADAAIAERARPPRTPAAAATEPPVSTMVAAGKSRADRPGTSTTAGSGMGTGGAPMESTDAGTLPPPGNRGSAPVTAWSRLPLTYRARVPTFSINVHVYAPEPARRFVMVDMKRYREGDTLPVGPRVESITSDGLVLAWRGRRFLWPVDGPPR